MLKNTNPLAKFGKLLKYDLLSCSRILIPLYIALVLFAFITGFSIDKENRFMGSQESFTSILHAMYIVLFVTVTISNLVIILNRFKNNLFGSEGYLFLSLPVGIPNHIFSKLVNCTIWILISVGISFLSILILARGTNAPKEVAEFFEQYFCELSTTPLATIWTTVYSFFVLVVSIMSLVLSFFVVISVSHLVQKGKAVVSIITFIALSTIDTNILAKFNLTGNEWSVKFLIVQIVWSAICFGIVDYILTDRLNLE